MVRRKNFDDQDEKLHFNDVCILSKGEITKEEALNMDIWNEKIMKI